MFVYSNVKFVFEISLKYQKKNIFMIYVMNLKIILQGSKKYLWHIKFNLWLFCREHILLHTLH